MTSLVTRPTAGAPWVVPGVRSAVSPAFAEAMPAGLDTEAIALLWDAVQVVLSFSIGERSPKGPHIENLNSGLRLYATTAAAGDDEYFPAWFPEMEFVPSRGGKTFLNRTGLTKPSFEKLWEQHTVEQGRAARFERAVLEEAITPDRWPVVAAMILDGPEVAVTRLHNYLLAERDRVVVGDSRGKREAPIADGFLRNQSRAMRNLMRQIANCRSRKRFAGLLEAWENIPFLAPPKGVEYKAILAVPSLHQLRKYLYEVDARIADKFGTDDRQRQVEIIADSPRWKLVTHGCFRTVRNRALFAITNSIGPRPEAVERLRVGGVVEDYQSPDGERGPALALFPEKTVDWRQVAYKPIARGAYLTIKAHLAYREALLGEPLPPDAPLLGTSMARPLEGLKYSGIYVLLRGGGFKASGRVKALIAIEEPAELPDDASKAERQAEQDKAYFGYAPQRYRASTLRQLRTRAAGKWLSERTDDHPVLIAEALTDHKVPKVDALGYLGGRDRAGKERLSRLGAECMWALLTGEAGAERVPDGATYRDARMNEKTLMAALDETRRKLDEQHAWRPPPIPEGGTVEEKLDHMLQRDEQRDEHARELARLDREERQLDSQLTATRERIAQLRHDQKTWISLPEDAGAEERMANDLAAIDEDLQIVSGEGEPVFEMARKYRAVSVAEWGYIAGVSKATTPRWLGEKGAAPKMSHPDGDPRNPWRSEELPVDDSLGLARRRILLDLVNPSFLATPERQQRMREVLGNKDRPDPKGWARGLIDRPLAFPEWHLERQRARAKK
jgi:hypothetical protein